MIIWTFLFKMSQTEFKDFIIGFSILLAPKEVETAQNLPKT